MLAVGLGGALEDGVDLADGLEGLRAPVGGGDCLAPLLGGRRCLVLLPDQRAAQSLPLLPAGGSRLQAASKGNGVWR